MLIYMDECYLVSSRVLATTLPLFAAKTPYYMSKIETYRYHAV